MAVLTYSAVAVGLKVLPVVIEAALGQGFSGLQIIGLPNDYCRDARERIRASIEAVGMSLPARRLIVSVRPSESLRQFKCGLEHLDLACAIAIVAALAEQTSPPKHKSLNLLQVKKALDASKCFFTGQLTLTGEILPQENSLPFELISLQTDTNQRVFFSTSENSTEDKDASEWHIVCTLSDCLNALNNWTPERSRTSHRTYDTPCRTHSLKHSEGDQCLRTDNLKQTLFQFSQQPALALGIYLAAAGRHHLLVSGSPGCGKTFALRAMQSLLPPLAQQERMEIALIHNRNSSGVSERPFRSPHHSAWAPLSLAAHSFSPERSHWLIMGFFSSTSWPNFSVRLSRRFGNPWTNVASPSQEPAVGRNFLPTSYSSLQPTPVLAATFSQSANRAAVRHRLHSDISKSSVAHCWNAFPYSY